MQRAEDVLGNSTYRKVILAFLLMGIGYLVFTQPFIRASLVRMAIAPSFEGPHTDIFCVQPSSNSNCYTANNQGTGFNWVISVPSNGKIIDNYYWQYTSQQTALTLQQYFTNGVTAQITSNNPFITTDVTPTTTACSSDPNAPQECWSMIKYWVRNPYNQSQWIQIYGYIIRYSYQLTVSIQPGSDPNVQFKGDTIWIRTYSPTFDNYAFDPRASNNLPNATQIGAWSAPMVLVLQSGSDAVVQQTGGYSTNDNTIPDWHNNNAPQTLYSTPQATSAIATLQLGSANQSLASGTNPYAPDTRLSQYAYFPVVLSRVGSFGYNCGVLGCTSTGYPAINLNFQIFYIQLGRYLFTNPVHHPLTTGANSATQTVAGALVGFLMNPWTILAGILAGSTIALAALLIFVGGPIAIILTAVMSRKKGETK